MEATETKHLTKDELTAEIQRVCGKLETALEGENRALCHLALAGTLGSSIKDMITESHDTTSPAFVVEAAIRGFAAWVMSSHPSSQTDQEARS